MSTGPSRRNRPTPEGRLPAPFLSLTRIYYLSGPLFLLLDYGTGLNIRTAAAEGIPSMKIIYSLAILSLALLSWQRPALIPFTGTVESGLNVGALIIRTFYGYFSTAMGLAWSGGMDPALSGPALINLVIAGTVGCLSFYTFRRRPS